MSYVCTVVHGTNLVLREDFRESSLVFLVDHGLPKIGGRGDGLNPEFPAIID